MDRDTLRAALAEIDGIEISGDRFEIAAKHGVTFYLGRPGSAMQVDQVARGTLAEAFLLLERRPPKDDRVVVGWDAVQGLRVAPEDDRAERRPGFG